MILLFLFFVLGQSSKLNRIIHDSIYWHMYVHDVNDICNIVLRRIGYQGVFITNKTVCTDAPIVSPLGNTLRELYYNYEIIRDNNIQIERHTLSNINAKAVKHCSRGFKILTIVDDIFPPLKYTKCFLNHFRMIGNQTCLPLETPYIGNWNIPDPNMDMCVNQLETLGEQYRILRDTEHMITQLTGKLAPEISKVWRHQMPEWLQKNSLTFDYGY